jgi:hypothetical protein
MLRDALIFGLCFGIMFAFASGEISVRLDNGKATIAFSKANSIEDAATDALNAVQDLSRPVKTTLVLTSAALALAILVWQERRTQAALDKKKRNISS